MIPLQMLNVSWSWQSLPIHRFQVIASLSQVVDDLVGSFPSWSELSLYWVLCFRFCVKWDLLCSILWALLFCCSTQSSFAGTWSFSWMLPPLSHPGNPGWPSADRHCCLLVVGDSHFDWYYCFSTIGEPEWCFSNWGSSHALFAPSRQTLMIFSNIRFVTFVYLLAYGCPGEENWFLIPSSEQKLLNSWLWNWRPLFEMIVLGMPNL